MKSRTSLLVMLLKVWLSPRQMLFFLISFGLVGLPRLVLFPAQPIPYYLQFNPGGALVPVCGILYGPAAAWGAAAASLVLDYVVGMNNRLSFFRAAGVFLFALSSWMAWHRIPLRRTGTQRNRLALSVHFLWAALAGIATEAAWLGLGSEWLRLYPFAYVASLTLAQHMVFVPLVGIPLIWLFALHGLPHPPAPPPARPLGHLLLPGSAWCALVAGFWLSWHLCGIAPWTPCVIGTTHCSWIPLAVAPPLLVQLYAL